MKEESKKKEDESVFDTSKLDHLTMSNFNHIFLVMEIIESDMKKLLSSTP